MTRSRFDICKPAMRFTTTDGRPRTHEERCKAPRALPADEICSMLESEQSQVLWVGNIDRCAHAACRRLGKQLCSSVHNLSLCAQPTRAGISSPTRHNRSYCRDMACAEVEAALRGHVPDAVHIEVLTFKSDAQRAHYPDGSQVRILPLPTAETVDTALLRQVDTLGIMRR